MGMERLKVTAQRIELLGMPMHVVRMGELVEYCEQAVTQRCSLVLGMVNVAKVVNGRKNRQLYESVASSDLIAADGQGVVWLSRLTGRPLPERVAGIDVMRALMELADRKQYRVFFLGAKAEVVQEVVRRAEADFPGLKVAGYRDGYFDLENEGREVAEQIATSRADILFVAITPPRKELFMDRWKETTAVPVCHGVGGSFDVYAGRIRRAPRWMQQAGLEWFFRVVQEPRRMWKRYLITNTVFLLLSVREIITVRLGRTR